MQLQAFLPNCSSPAAAGSGAVKYSSSGRWAFRQSAENPPIPQQLIEAVGLKMYEGGRDQLSLQIFGRFMAMIPCIRGCPIPRWDVSAPDNGF